MSPNQDLHSERRVSSVMKLVFRIRKSHANTPKISPPVPPTSTEKRPKKKNGSFDCSQISDNSFVPPIMRIPEMKTPSIPTISPTQPRKRRIIRATTRRNRVSSLLAAFSSCRSNRSLLCPILLPKIRYALTRPSGRVFTFDILTTWEPLGIISGPRRQKFFLCRKHNSPPDHLGSQAGCRENLIF